MQNNTRKNIAWSILGNFGKIISQALYFIIIARLLGVQQYGVFASIFAFVNLFVPFSTLGLGNLLVMNVARDKTLFKDFFGISIIMIVLFGGILSLVATFTGVLFYGKNIILIIFLLSISELVFFRFIDICSQSFQAHEDMRRASGVYLFSAFARMLLAALAYIIGIENLLTWMLFYLIGNVSVGLFSLYYCIKRLDKPNFKTSLIAVHINHGLPYTFGIASTSVYTDIDKILLLKYTEPSIGGEYNAAYRFIIMALAPLQAVVYALNTRMFKQGAEGLSALKPIMIKIARYIIILASFVSLVYILFGQFLLHILGSEYANSKNILMFMLPLLFLSSLNNLIGDILMGAGYQKERAIVQVCAAGMALLIGISFIPRYGWKGAIITAISAQVFVLCALSYIVFTKMSKEKSEQ